MWTDGAFLLRLCLPGLATQTNQPRNAELAQCIRFTGKRVAARRTSRSLRRLSKIKALQYIACRCITRRQRL